MPGGLDTRAIATAAMPPPPTAAADPRPDACRARRPTSFAAHAALLLGSRSNLWHTLGQLRSSGGARISDRHRAIPRRAGGDAPGGGAENDVNFVSKAAECIPVTFVYSDQKAPFFFARTFVIYIPERVNISSSSSSVYHIEV